MTSQLDIENLVIAYDGEQILKQVAFSLAAGSIGCLLGPSGCGKTTILRAIAGFEAVRQGRILIDHVEVSSPGYCLTPDKRNIGMVFQTPGLWNHMSVIKNIGFGIDVKKESSRVKLVSEKLQIQHLLNKFPEHLSGGEKKRVALARMLVHQWQYLLILKPL